MSYQNDGNYGKEADLDGEQKYGGVKVTVSPEIRNFDAQAQGQLQAQLEAQLERQAQFEAQAQAQMQKIFALLTDIKKKL